MADPSKDLRIVLDHGVLGPGSNVNHGPQTNKGGNGGNCSKDGNAGHGGAGNGNNNITHGLTKGANVPKDSKEQPIENNKSDASGAHEPGSNVNFGRQDNQGGKGGDCNHGGNAGLGGAGNGNNNITYC